MPPRAALALRDGKSKGEASKAAAGDGECAKLVAEVIECMRMYDVFGLLDDVEGGLRCEVMRAFVKKVRLFPGLPCS